MNPMPIDYLARLESWMKPGARCEYAGVDHPREWKPARIESVSPKGRIGITVLVQPFRYPKLTTPNRIRPVH